jgi:SAM-dependent methyltransferase/uncharacterized protein YbaR (Trm112 family)
MKAVEKQDAAQPMSVKRAQVEFHNFASLGEPERALRVYREENLRRGALLESQRDFVPALTPFLEIGANAGHTSYYLANEMGAEGFALDLSADALRHGQFLRRAWGYEKTPVLVAGDAMRLPFRDGALRFVMVFQTLSQFPDTRAVLAEASRVLAPGGVLYFAEEPVRRRLTLGLYRAPYPERMKPWEKRLFETGWLEFIARDVIGAHQEESFGIRQNHRHDLRAWRAMLNSLFEDVRLVTFARDRGWANQFVRRVLWKLDPAKAEMRAASLLGATLAAFCRKAGALPEESPPLMELLACPDCGADLGHPESDLLRCSSCRYEARREEGVFNLLNSKDRTELYPGPRPDILNFAQHGHEAGLIEGFFELEGDFGNRYRWIGPKAVARLPRLRPEPLLLRIRGFAHEGMFTVDRPRVEIRVNNTPLKSWRLDRPGLFILEADLPEAQDYTVEILSSPVWIAPGDDRRFTINLSEIRLAPRS